MSVSTSPEWLEDESEDVDSEDMARLRIEGGDWSVVGIVSWDEAELTTVVESLSMLRRRLDFEEIEDFDKRSERLLEDFGGENSLVK